MKTEASPAFKQHLRDHYRIGLVFPGYTWWGYDRPVEDDPFLNQLMQDMDRAPALREVAQRLGATIYPCSNLGATHLPSTIFYGRADSSSGFCDPLRGEIILGRESFPEAAHIAVPTTEPGMVTGHELGHILDSRLGTCIDPYGEDPPVPTTRLHIYAQDAFAADIAQQQAAGLSDAFTSRAGLLAGEAPGRSSPTEIICDMLGHLWSGRDQEAYQALVTHYPQLHQVALVMTAAAKSPEAMAAYKTRAAWVTPFSQMRVAGG